MEGKWVWRCVTLLVVFIVLWTAFFAAYVFAAELAATPPPQWTGIGTAALRYINTAHVLESGSSPYNIGGFWDSPLNSTYDLAFSSLVIGSLIHIFASKTTILLLHLLGYVSIPLTAFLTIQIIEGEVGDMRPKWSWVILLSNSALVYAALQGSIEGVLLCALLGSILALQKKNYFLAGILMGCLFATEFRWLVFPFMYAIAKGEWKTLGKVFLVGLIFHIFINAPAVISLGQQGFNIYLQRYPLLWSSITQPPTFVLAGYWDTSGLTQLVVNLSIPKGNVWLITGFLFLLFLTVTFIMFWKGMNKVLALPYGVFAWILVTIQQPQLLYASLLAAAVVFCLTWKPVNRFACLVTLIGLFYVLGQFPTYLYESLGVGWNMSSTPALILGLIACFVAYGWMLVSYKQ